MIQPTVPDKKPTSANYFKKIANLSKKRNNNARLPLPPTPPSKNEHNNNNGNNNNEPPPPPPPLPPTPPSKNEHNNNNGNNNNEPPPPPPLLPPHNKGEQAARNAAKAKEQLHTLLVNAKKVQNKLNQQSSMAKRNANAVQANNTTRKVRAKLLANNAVKELAKMQLKKMKPTYNTAAANAAVKGHSNMITRAEQNKAEASKKLGFLENELEFYMKNSPQWIATSKELKEGINKYEEKYQEPYKRLSGGRKKTRRHRRNRNRTRR